MPTEELPTSITLPTDEELNRIWHSIDPELPDFIFQWTTRTTTVAGTIFYKERLLRLSVRHYYEFGIDGIEDIMRHEAAHWIAWHKYRDRGHGQSFYYYLGKFGSSRHCKTLSANIKARKFKLIGERNTHGIEYDPITKMFRQRRR